MVDLAHDGLVCDTCHQPIEAINLAMVFFSHENGAAGNLRLAHKGQRCDPNTEDSSLELGWLANDGLFHVVRLAHSYTWSGADLKRLLGIVWLLTPDDGLGGDTFERLRASRARKSKQGLTENDIRQVVSQPLSVDLRNRQ